jgi:hypothetical protein
MTRSRAILGSASHTSDTGNGVRTPQDRGPPAQLGHYGEARLTLHPNRGPAHTNFKKE